MNMKKRAYYISMPAVAVCLLLLVAMSGCKKYLDVPVPISSVAGSTVFSTDNSSASALNSVYGSLYTGGYFDGNTAVGFYTGLYSDELKNQSVLPSNLAVYQDGVSSTIGSVTSFWTNFYSVCYSANLAIEGLTAANGLVYKNQWLGEA